MNTIASLLNYLAATQAEMMAGSPLFSIFLLDALALALLLDLLVIKKSGPWVALVPMLVVIFAAGLVQLASWGGGG